MNKLIIALSLIGSVLLLVSRYSVDLGICGKREISCIVGWDTLENILYLLPLVLVFSLVTFWLPQRVFESWLKFLLIWGSFTLVVTAVIHMKWHHSGVGIMNMDNILDLPIIYMMYGVFLVGSIVSVVRGYNSSRESEKCVID